MGLADYDSAAKMRDVVTSIVRQEMTGQRPGATYCSVVSVDRANSKALVTFPGGGAVNVPMSTIQPYGAASVVRVVGDSGDRHIEDVVRGATGAWVQASMFEALAGTTPQGGQMQLTGAPTKLSFFVQTASDLFKVTRTDTVADLFMVDGNGVGFAKKFQAGASGTNTNPSEPFHAYGPNAGYSFDAVTGSANRWTLRSTDANWCSLMFGGTDRLKVSANGRIQIGYLGAGLATNFATVTFAIGNNTMAGGSATWDHSQLVLFNEVSGGYCGLSAYCSFYSTAPMWVHAGSAGESWQAINSIGTAWIPIFASAFTVPSTERVKQNIQRLRGVDVGRPAETTMRQVVKAIPARKWDKAEHTRTQNIDPKTGKSHTHVCGQDCSAEPGTVCAVGHNDRLPGLGLVAEEVHAVLPEAVVLDEDMLPLGLDLAKLVGALWAAVQELTDEVEDLRKAQSQKPK